jgi:vacuolar-type H+-ATPase subunit I/STV1
MEQLETELKQLTEEKVRFSQEIEMLHAERVKQIQKEQEDLKNYRLECQAYESWQEALIVQNHYLEKVRKAVCSEAWNEQEWELFMKHFETVYPGFVERLPLVSMLREREIWICCLVKLGIKTAKIADFLGIGTDMTTRIKGDIRKRCFPTEKGKSLDRILKKWY